MKNHYIGDVRDFLKHGLILKLIQRPGNTNFPFVHRLTRDDGYFRHEGRGEGPQKIFQNIYSITGSATAGVSSSIVVFIPAKIRETGQTAWRGIGEYAGENGSPQLEMKR